jgi:hypothetical protein
MKYIKGVGAILSGAAVLALSCGAAFAVPLKSLTYTFSVPSGSTNWSSSIGLQKFSHSMGTLQSVEVDLAASVTGSLNVANTQTFSNVTSGAKSAIASTAGFTTAAHTTHCTAASTSCSIWNITYTSAPPATIPTSTIHSNLSAQITLHLGPTSLGAAPTVSETDVLSAGPGYSPGSYNFVKQYSGAVITKAAALAKTISSAGIISPNVVPSPSGPFLTSPCNDVFGSCTVGSAGYVTGVSHSGLLASASNSAFYTTPANLAFFYGNSVVILPIDAVGASSHDGGANVTFESTAFAAAGVNVIYTYIPAPEPMTLALFGAGLAITGLRRTRKSKKSKR